MSEDHDAVTGEVLPNSDLVLENGIAGAMMRAEIDTQVATARQYPRSIKSAINNILTLATLDEETATECIYALKRGGKPIRGPSIRLADIIASQWGNCRDGAQVITIDRVNKIITSEGVYHDLETNRGTRATVQRRISDKHGRLFSDDMIAVTGNAANSIARRNAILAGVPKAIWRKAVEACERIIRGDAVTLVERRGEALKALAHFNFSEEQIFAFLDVQGADDIDLDDLVSLRTLYANLKNGETTTEEVLRGLKPVSGHETVQNPLKDKPDDAPVSSPAKVEAVPERDQAETKDTALPAAKKKAETKAVEKSDPLAAITTREAYRDHALAWIASSTDVELLRAQWSRERPKRTDLAMSEDEAMLLEISGAQAAKVKALQKSAA